jgi:hypothetical protein
MNSLQKKVKIWVRHDTIITLKRRSDFNVRFRRSFSSSFRLPVHFHKECRGKWRNHIVVNSPGIQNSGNGRVVSREETHSPEGFFILEGRLFCWPGVPPHFRTDFEIVQNLTNHGTSDQSLHFRCFSCPTERDCLQVV